VLHHIDPSKLGPHGPVMARAVSTCVHCGFCLPACPTYHVLGEEMDSPRGRIILMKSVLEGEIALDEALPYVDRCLGCVACVTACPSGVEYGELLTPFRAKAERERRRSLVDRLRRHLTLETLPYPTRFRLAARLGQIGRRMRGLVPGPFRAMLDLLPPSLPPAAPLPALAPALGTRRARVALLAGCAQQVLEPNIGHAALRVLTRAGVEVVVPREQVCCGALALHVGEEARARSLALDNLRAFPDDVDAIVTTAAGCGSGLQEYGLLFEGSTDEARARRFASRVVDVAQFLDGLGVSDLPPLSAPVVVAYHDACHLAHAQGVRSAPRALLRRIPNVTLVDIPDGGHCCGSAGTYNLDQPEIARELGARKASAILSTGAALVVSGNIGCLTQVRTHLQGAPRSIEVLHTIELLDRAWSPR
jgi:glycolate oxidase iron-sulfur subunit